MAFLKGYGLIIAEMAAEENIWVLADDRAGNRSQALGVAEALGEPYTVKEVTYGAWAKLPNVFLGASALGLTKSSRQEIAPPWPRMVIAAGRRTAPVALSIKRRASGSVSLVQIMHPGAAVASFDLIAQPAHDPPLTGDNVLTVTGAPHGLSVDVLNAAKDRWFEELSAMPAPRIAVFVGGSTRRRTFTRDMAVELGQGVSKMAADAGGSLMVTTSRRTGEAADALIEAIDAPARVHRWDDTADNPYQGFLACADAVVVTGDSVSMCSEACAGTIPVQIYAPPALITEKHARCHQSLYDGGYAQPFDGAYGAAAHPRLNAANDIAAAIRERNLLG